MSVSIQPHEGGQDGNKQSGKTIEVDHEPDTEFKEGI